LLATVYEDLNKKPDPNDWSKCSPIKSATDKFSLKCPTEKDIKFLIKKLNKNLIPGSNKITYLNLFK